MNNKKAGKIYILRNPYHKDAIIKIGRTSRISETRAKEISSGTGIPSEFEVLYEEDVFDSILAENLIHKRLDLNRINKKREFFNIPLKKAVQVVFETCNKINKDTKKFASNKMVLYLEPKGKLPIDKILEILTKYKGGRTEVYLLKDLVFLKMAKKYNTRLSAALINEFKRIRNVKDIFWTQKDVRKYNKRFSNFPTEEEVNAD
ncbi:MAG: GIY-YIG nuclease family protein [Candidatus Omnitrophota bacterium]